MPMDKRPFVDRRIGVLVLLRGDEPVQLSERQIENRFESGLSERGLSLFVTRVEVPEGGPPQAKIILSESNVDSSTPATLGRIAREDVFEGGVQRVQIFSAALSPGDQVRNAMGV